MLRFIFQRGERRPLPIVRVLNLIWCVAFGLSFVWVFVRSGPIPVVVVAVLVLIAPPLLLLDYLTRPRRQGPPDAS
jgi:hypothetical protein